MTTPRDRWLPHRAEAPGTTRTPDGVQVRLAGSERLLARHVVVAVDPSCLAELTSLPAVAMRGLLAGAFGQKNAVQQSTKLALDQILTQLITDLNALADSRAR